MTSVSELELDLDVFQGPFDLLLAVLLREEISLAEVELGEIVLLRGTTEAVNLVAQSYGRRHVGAGDEVLITGLEHHSNIVPWQMLCEEKGATLRVAPIDDAGEVDMAAFERLLSPRTRIVSEIAEVRPNDRLEPMAAKLFQWDWDKGIYTEPERPTEDKLRPMLERASRTSGIPWEAR
mgnify:CR=1 FL=1